MVEELIYYKVLPFAVYGKKGELILSEGETLTPNKIATLRKMPVIYKKSKDDTEAIVDYNKMNAVDAELENLAKAKHPQLQPSGQPQQKEHEADASLIAKLDENIIIEKIDFIRPVEKRTHSYIDNINVDNYKGPLNKDSIIDYDVQIKIKTVFINALQLFQSGEIDKSLELFLEVRSKIIEELKALADNINKCSGLLFLGEYSNCHLLNTAMLSTALAMRVGYKEEALADVTLSALLHDIGKYRLSAMAPLKEHALLGYDIIKEEFKLPKRVAIAVLCHHENNDGSGYPNGLSGEQIDIPSNIISICSTFDNLVFNRTNFKINNNREALREMLNMGTGTFLPDLFYTFIHMFSYNDVKPLKEMVFE